MRSDPLAGGERPISRAAEGRRIGERELIGMMALLMALNALGIDAILPALDELARDMSVEGNSRQFVVGAYLLAAGIGALVPGSIADRYGRRPVLFASLAAYTEKDGILKKDDVIIAVGGQRVGSDGSILLHGNRVY